MLSGRLGHTFDDTIAIGVAAAMFGLPGLPPEAAPEVASRPLPAT